jgi:hypothetical protein
MRTEIYGEFKREREKQKQKPKPKQKQKQSDMRKEESQACARGYAEG